MKGLTQHLLYVAQYISDWNESVWRNRSAAKMKRWSFLLIVCAICMYYFVIEQLRSSGCSVVVFCSLFHLIVLVVFPMVFVLFLCVVSVTLQSPQCSGSTLLGFQQ